MVQIVEFKRQSFLFQPGGASGTPIAMIEQGEGSRYELSHSMTTASTPNGFVEIKIPLAPATKQTWFAQADSVQELSFSPSDPTQPCDPASSTIEFTNLAGSYLKQDTSRDGEDAPTGGAIFQGKGARCKVYFTPAKRAGHSEVRIPIKPGGKETWWVFDGHYKKV